jgi:uncharacterized protein YjiS (DUF1127 family)
MTAIPFQAPNRAARRVSFRKRHGRVRRFAEFALARLRAWRRCVRNRNELMALDDRTLRDIGLSRGEIPYRAGKAAERETWAEFPHFPPY